MLYNADPYPEVAPPYVPTTTFKYNYPLDCNMQPGSEDHQKLLARILHRASHAKARMSTRYSSWNETDRLLNVHMYVDDAEAKVKSKDSRKPVSMIFPQTLTIMETLLSYSIGALYGPPMFKYAAVDPDDEVAAALMELVVQHLAMRKKVPLQLYILLRDTFAYGVGYAAPVWESKVYRSYVANKNAFDVNAPKRELSERISEGNVLMNLNPYLVLPDPTVAPHRMQEAEFFGWADTVSLMTLIEEDERTYFNVKYVKSDQNRGSLFTGDSSMRSIKTGASIVADDPSCLTNPVGRVQMYVRLIPADWKLGDSEKPELWKFTVCADKYIVQAEQLGLAHGMIPVVTMSPDFDGYSPQALSRMEVLHELQGLLDWMLNSHIKNVRKMVNDTLVVDPGRVNISDIADVHSRGGGIIRLLNPIWGQGISDAIMQLPISDVTRQHVAEAPFVLDFMSRVTGTDASSMGLLRQGGPERLSAQEFLGTRQGMVGRLERILRLINLQGMRDIATMFAYHTQQFMEQDVYTKITGRHEEILRKVYPQSAQVSPKDILVEFDLEPDTLALPGSSSVDVWMRFFEVIAKDPELRMMFNIPGIAMQMLHEAGAKINPSQLKAQAMPDQAVQQQVQQGNMMPMQQMPQMQPPMGFMGGENA